MVVNGTAESDRSRVQALAANDPTLIPSFGIHPWFAATRSADWARHWNRFLFTLHQRSGKPASIAIYPITRSKIKSRSLSTDWYDALRRVRKRLIGPESAICFKGLLRTRPSTSPPISMSIQVDPRPFTSIQVHSSPFKSTSSHKNPRAIQIPANHNVRTRRSNRKEHLYYFARHKTT
jgi:hypothetical protein